MANLFRGSVLLKNNQFVDPVFLPKYQDKAIYEVLRIIDGVPVFWREHYLRLKNSAKLAHVSIDLQEEEFAFRLRNIIQKSKYDIGNIRLLFVVENDRIISYFYFVPHKYPEFSEYQNGVDVGILHAERISPQVKVVQKQLRDRALQMKNEKGFYEILLVNKYGQLTEGSQSNVFFVKGNEFFTAEAGQVLKGITRKKVMERITSMDCNINETHVSIDELSEFDSIFLTGTSPKVLPVAKVEHMRFETSNPFVLELMKSYDQLLLEEINNNKSFFSS